MRIIILIILHFNLHYLHQHTYYISHFFALIEFGIGPAISILLLFLLKNLLLDLFINSTAFKFIKSNFHLYYICIISFFWLCFSLF